MIDPGRLPLELQTLLPLLDEWAIADDMDRSLKVEHASPYELRDLVARVDAVDQDTLYGWLAGPEAQSSRPSAEYLAITCLTMAADEARVTLKTTL